MEGRTSLGSTHGSFTTWTGLNQRLEHLHKQPLLLSNMPTSVVIVTKKPLKSTVHLNVIFLWFSLKFDSNFRPRQSKTILKLRCVSLYAFLCLYIFLLYVLTRPKGGRTHRNTSNQYKNRVIMIK